MAHVIQGLDVAVSAPVKKNFSEAHTKFEQQNHQMVTKADFLSVYGQTHVCAFTPDIIKTAFQKTGVHTFNPDAINPNQLAPSCSSSTTQDLPLPQPPPIHAISQLLHELSLASSADSSHAGSQQPSQAGSQDMSGHAPPSLDSPEDLESEDGGAGNLIGHRDDEMSHSDKEEDSRDDLQSNNNL